MKKINVTVIAAFLVFLHVLVFALAIGTKGEKSKPAPKEKRQSPAADNQPEKTIPAPDSGFVAPLPAPVPLEEPPQPLEVAKMPPAQQRETIATPSGTPGHLRSDRPDRRTAKIYSKLVGTPYASAITVDARTGRILFENRAAAYAYPASITKMMTMLIVLEQIDAGLIGFEDKVEITEEVATVGGSEIYLDTRESGAYTVDDLLKALMIHSANDAARALALHVAGSRDAFVDMMNQKARELGMNSTVYHSEHGLPPSDGSQPDISTAYDIAILGLAALRHPKTLEYTGTKLDWLPLSPIRTEKFMLANRNALVGKDPYPGCDGLKTGYHSKGGFSLAATAKQGNDRIISVVLGVADRNARNAITRELLDKGFQSLK